MEAELGIYQPLPFPHTDLPYHRHHPGSPNSCFKMISDHLQGLGAREFLLLAVALFALYRIYGRATEERKIQALGGHGPRVISKLPLGTVMLMDLSPDPSCTFRGTSADASQRY